MILPKFLPTILYFLIFVSSTHSCLSFNNGFSSPGVNNPSNGKNILLPQNVIPIHYDLQFQPSFKNFIFQGNSSIELVVKQRTSKLIFHGRHLNIQESSLRRVCHNCLPISIVAIGEDKELEQITLELNEELHPSETVILQVKYLGLLSDDLNGFYRSRYIASNGVESYIATTQFQTTFARKAFPCWDEPSLKATFDITLVVPKEMTALSNMNVISEKMNGSLKAVKFATTPTMSTYLVAFVVGDLGYVETFTEKEHNGRKVPVRVYAPNGEEKKGEFAVNLGAKALDFYAEAFGIDYQLPKLDNVAIPDFDAGAMENWGLSLYRTVFLLDDPQTSYLVYRQRIAEVVAHELAHQWFGNLVTLSWWSDMWLNEGITTWASYLALASIFPEWDPWSLFVDTRYRSALLADSFLNSYPIRKDVVSTKQAKGMLNLMTFSKASSVLRMLSNYIGLSEFLKGLNFYLIRHQYSNVNTEDLYHDLSSVLHLNIESLFRNWIEQPGFPILSVRQHKDKLILTQERYIAFGTIPEVQKTLVWSVPIKSVSKDSNVIIDQLMETKQLTISMDGDYPFIKLNTNQEGFYRVNYSTELFDRLKKAIQEGHLSSNDKAGLISDIAALAQSGHAKTVDLFDIVVSLKPNDQYLVWKEVAISLSSIQSVWYEQSKRVRHQLTQLQRELFYPIVVDLGFEFKSDEKTSIRQLRLLAIQQTGYTCEEETFSKSRQLFLDYISGKQNAIPSDLISIIFSINLRCGPRTVFYQLLHLYLIRKDQQARLTILNVIGDTPHEDQISQLIHFNYSSHIRNQDKFHIVRSLGKNPKARLILWNWYKENLDKLLDDFQESIGIFQIITEASIVKFSSKAMLIEIEDFFERKNSEKFPISIQQYINEVNRNYLWLIKEKDDLEEWLSEFYG